MQATAKFSGTQLLIQLSSENDGEKVLLNLVDGATPKFAMSEPVGENTTGASLAIAAIEMDKSKRA